jgi:hypothetical protein
MAHITDEIAAGITERGIDGLHVEPQTGGDCWLVWTTRENGDEVFVCQDSAGTWKRDDENGMESSLGDMDGNGPFGTVYSLTPDGMECAGDWPTVAEYVAAFMAEYVA